MGHEFDQVRATGIPDNEAESRSLTEFAVVLCLDFVCTTMTGSRHRLK
jgi:hypothetical protein